MGRSEHDGRCMTSMGAAELAGGIAQGDFTSLDVVVAHIERIKAIEDRLNALVFRRFDEARSEAAAADQQQAAGRSLGPLHGVPVTLKDCFHLGGSDSTIGIESLVGQPDRADGLLVRRLRDAGAIILGKTNVPQLMMLHETDNPIYGRTNNPWNLDRSPGGSSGGEAAIIAAGGSPLGLGSDLGGSIRQPAHSCGICGLKPTSGRLSTQGCRLTLAGQTMIPFQPGPIARRVEDLALAMQVLVGSSGESGEPDVPPVAWLHSKDVRLDQLRVGVCEDDGYFRPSPAIRRAVVEAGKILAAGGAKVVGFVPPDIGEMMQLYVAAIAADGMAGFRRMLRHSRRDWRIARLIRLGSMKSWLRPPLAAVSEITGQRRMADLIRAGRGGSVDELWQLAERVMNYQRRFMTAMEQAEVDVLLLPPHGLPALTHGSTAHLLAAASYCFLPNLVGIPAGVVPATRVRPDEETDRVMSRDLCDRTSMGVERGSSGLPIGVQVAARHWREDQVLAVMKTLESQFRQRPDFPSDDGVGII